MGCLEYMAAIVDVAAAAVAAGVFAGTSAAHTCVDALLRQRLLGGVARTSAAASDHVPRARACPHKEPDWHREQDVGNG
eukprot:366016-Chlamydomonas_euryale.AAC.5